MRTIFLVITALLVLHGVSPAEYTVQVGAFQSARLAAEQVEYVGRAGYPAFIEHVERFGKPALAIVVVGPYEKFGAAEAVRAALVLNGIEGFVRTYKNRAVA